MKKKISMASWVFVGLAALQCVVAYVDHDAGWLIVAGVLLIPAWFLKDGFQ